MAVGALAYKFGSLAVRTAAKPLAKKFRKSAENSEFWRSVFIGYAQWQHRVEYNISIRMLGHPPSRVKPLEPERAVSVGSEMLSELFVLGVACAVIAAEYSRSKLSEGHKKEEAIEKERIFKKQVNERLVSMELSILELEAKVELNRDMSANSTKMVMEQIQKLKDVFPTASS